MTDKSERGPEPLLLAVGALAAGLFLGIASRARRNTALPGDLAARRAAASAPSIPAKLVGLSGWPLGFPAVYFSAAWLASEWLRLRGREASRAPLETAFATWVAYRLTKLAVDRQRPGGGDGTRDWSSFPSGHSAGATGVALIVAYSLWREDAISAGRLVALAAGVPAFVSVSRVAQDQHWLSDTIGGVLVGTVTAAAGAYRMEAAGGDAGAAA